MPGGLLAEVLWDFNSIVTIYFYALATYINDDITHVNDRYCLVGFEEHDGSNSAHACDDCTIGSLRIR